MLGSIWVSLILGNYHMYPPQIDNTYPVDRIWRDLIMIMGNSIFYLRGTRYCKRILQPQRRGGYTQLSFAFLDPKRYFANLD